MAIKFLEGVEADTAEGHKQLVLLLNEAKMLNALSHSNVVRGFGVDCLGGRLCVVTELMDVPLAEWIERQQPSRASTSAAQEQWHEVLQRIALDVARGCRYMAQKRVVHSDLHGGNVLLAVERDEHGAEVVTAAKVSDFGLAKMLASDGHAHVEHVRPMHHIHYSAPEVMQWWRFSEASDVYSFAMLVYVMFNGQQHPYAAWSEREVVEHFESSEYAAPEIPEGWPTAIRRVISRGWRCRRGSGRRSSGYVRSSTHSEQ